MQKLLIAIMCLWLTSCSTANPNVDIQNVGELPRRLVGVLADPIVNFTVADAKSAIKWADDEIAAGRLTPDMAVKAKACPNSIIAMSDFYNSLKLSDQQDGVKGLIYYWTIQQYGAQGSIENKGKALALTIMAECGKLVPSNRFAPGAIGMLAR